MSEGNLPVALADVESALAEIQPTVGTPGYWRNRDTQDRYLALLTRKEQLQAEPVADPQAGPMEWASRAEFLSACPGGDYGQYADAMRSAGDIWIRLPEDEQDAFLASFEALPDRVVSHITAELLDRSHAAPDPMPEDFLPSFAAGQGRVIVAEWGREAPEKIARARGRLWRLIDGLESDSDVGGFMDWLGRLSPDSAAAVYRKLGG